MKKESLTSSPPERGKVTAYFQTKSSYWKDVYSATGVYPEIYSDRHKAILAWIDDLGLPPDSRVLEVGCGAGFMTIALAERGLRVEAIDSSEAMVELARQHAREGGVDNLISLELGDVYLLASPGSSFDLVIAIGVLPWLDKPETAMREMARVAKPGGYVIVTADNRNRLSNLLDPLLNPAVVPLKRGVKKLLDRVRLRRLSLKDVGVTFRSCRFIDGALARAQLEKTKSMTLGFGPFSLFRRTIIPERVGILLHRRLQQLAARNTPIFRSTGSQYLVLARKPTGLAESKKRVAGAQRRQ